METERDAPAAPGAQRHDGFMLRLTLGFGYSTTSATAKDDPDEAALFGVSGSFAIDLGVALTENLLLHLRLADLYVLNPGVSVNGMKEQSTSELTFGAFFIGPGLSYYIMPANLYLTFTAGIAWMTVDTDRSEANSTDVGFGANAELGKEWWVSDNWGLGLAGRFWLSKANDTNGDFEETLTTLGFVVVFSATLN
ncbi:MAG TPA: outer membrane beta-barrel protein [Polyangiales bacterium]|nr:outer membrane beta-barrel protein [Polyangiales bacterium]